MDGHIEHGLDAEVSSVTVEARWHSEYSTEKRVEGLDYVAELFEYVICRLSNGIYYKTVVPKTAKPKD